MNIVRNLVKVSFSPYWKNALTFLNFVLDSWYWISMDSRLWLNLYMFLKVLLEVAYVQRCLEIEPHFLRSERCQQYAGVLTCLQVAQLWRRVRVENEPVLHTWEKRKEESRASVGKRCSSYVVPLIHLWEKCIHFLQRLAKWEEQKQCYSTLEHKVTVDSASEAERCRKQFLNHRKYTEWKVFMIRHCLS